MNADDEDLEALTNWEPGWFERETVSRALAGDREAALEAIDLTISRLLTGTLSRELGTYIACALEQVHRERDSLIGETFIRAFNLTRDPNRPPEPRTMSRDIDIAAWVHIARARGLTPAEAKGRASAAFGIENIDRSLRKAGPVQWVNEEQYERIFSERGMPLPPRQ